MFNKRVSTAVINSLNRNSHGPSSSRPTQCKELFLFNDNDKIICNNFKSILTFVSPVKKMTDRTMRTVFVYPGLIEFKNYKNQG